MSTKARQIPVITVIPLGPGAPELLTLQSAEALKKAKHLFLRTGKHPVAAWLREQSVPFESMDAFYDRFDDFDRMHEAMAQFLWQEAADGPIAFAVMDPARDGAVRALKNWIRSEGELPERKNAGPGSKAKSERPDRDGNLIILPGLSTLDACESEQPLSIKPRSAGEGFRVFSATDFLSASVDPALDLWVLEIDTALLAGEVKLHLLDLYDDEQPVIFFPPSDKSRRISRTIPLYLLDCQKAYDHTTAFLIPGADFTQRSRFTFADLEAILSRLRAPDGCPWDRIQTHVSLTPYMVEEAWEAVSAIEEGDMDHLSDELGDVLFQVFFHASIGQTFEEFTMADVLTHICRKMIQRHPHVFGTEHKNSAETVADTWETIKRRETGSKTVGESLEDVSTALPSLKYAIKICKKLAQLPALRRSPEEIAAEIRRLSETLLEDHKLSARKLASLLLKCTELCYRKDMDAEILLHHEVDQLKRQFQAAEKAVLADRKLPESLTNQQLRVYLEAAAGGNESTFSLMEQNS
ncbi:MAG: MazG family protein [Clostridia bacterium]|nr:MazG family protein [Clostridia bacterium]